MRTFCTESRRIPNRKAINFGGGTVPNPGSRLVEVKKHFALIAVRIGHANQLFLPKKTRREVYCSWLLPILLGVYDVKRKI